MMIMYKYIITKLISNGTSYEKKRSDPGMNLIHGIYTLSSRLLSIHREIRQYLSKGTES